METIPSKNRNAVYFYTTSFNTGPWYENNCDLPSIVLDNPDDGTVEMSRGQLPGGNNMGNKKGWCHGDDMLDPDQKEDATRNRIMNSQAKY